MREAGACENKRWRTWVTGPELPEYGGKEDGNGSRGKKEVRCCPSMSSQVYPSQASGCEPGVAEFADAVVSLRL